MKYTKKEALDFMTELSRYSIKPKFAKDLARAFKCKVNDSLIVTTEQPRELVENSSTPRVNMCDLAESICSQLNIEPDKELMALSRRFHGVGRITETITEACVKSLKQKDL